MFLRFLNSTIITSLFFSSFMYGNQGVAAYFTTDTIYHYASENQTDTLINFLKYGYSIDMMDAYGNTALCKAILYEDKEAVQNLIELGANRNANCLHQIPSEKFYRVGLIQKFTSSTNMRSGKASPPLASMIWNHKIFWTLGAATAAILALGGGGGGGSGNGGVPEKNPEDQTTTLAKVSSIDAVIQSGLCPEGMYLINGVCTTPILGSVSGLEPISTEQSVSPYYLAEFGGSIATPQESDLDFYGNDSLPVIAMQANGVSVSALSKDGTTVNVEKAATATNVKSTSITMTEESDTDKGVIAMYATAAGTITNEGDITIISKSENESAAMKSDREISLTGVPGTGANITNNGTITVIDTENGSGTVSAISAPGRGVTNNGAITLKLEPMNAPIPEKGAGVIQGIYGKNIVNKGTITLDSATSTETIQSEAYLIRGFGDQGSIIANDGILNIGLTKISSGIKGLWSDPSNNGGVTIKNTGEINVNGILYNTENSSISKQVYLMGSEGGIAYTTNYGKINVGFLEAPIDVSNGGILIAMNGANGELTNEGLINFHLYATPNTNSNEFTANAMTLMDGTITNNKDIYFSFNNEGSVKSNSNIRLSAIESYASDPSGDNYTSLTNNGTIKADLIGSAGDGFFATMKSSNGDLINTDKIEITSNMDNLDLIGLKSESGYLKNDETAEIILTSKGGENVNLIGGYSKGNDEGSNEGYVFLKHYEGSGDITGFGAENNGLIQIEANDMTGFSHISGGIAYASVSETPEDPIETDLTESEEEVIEEEIQTTAEAATKKAKGMTNITLTGTTAGTVNGFEYENGNPRGITNHQSANTINITAQSTNRQDDLLIYGIFTGDNTNTSRDGILTINATGSKVYNTELYGLYAENADITNEKTSVVNLNLNLNGSTDYFVAGMTTIDTSIKQYDGTTKTTRTENNGYRAYNAGTININVSGTTHNPDEYYENNKVPFDVVGMLTNSYALNTGTIKLNIDYNPDTKSGAKVAGMVAYDGGVIANQGTIIFSGCTNNFTPLYATGNNRLYKVEHPSNKVTITTTKDYYATVYNSGKIIVNKVLDFVDPDGDGYYQKNNPTEYVNVHTEPWSLDSLTTNISAEDAWAREWEIITETITDDGIETEIDAGDTRGYFEEFGDPEDVPIDIPPTTPVTTLTSFVNATNLNTQATNSGSQENIQSPDIDEITESVNQSLDTQTTDMNFSNQQNLYTLRINDGMKYVSELGGSFEAEGTHLIGDITAGQSLVLNGNKDTYISSGSGQGALVGDGNTSDLSLTSNSILFNATYAKNNTNKNGIDIVMTRKSFHELVNNNSLASYLENNYKLGNNENLFNQLKSNTNLSNLTNSLNKLTGKELMSRFNFEDMTLMRELNYNLNDNIFHSKEETISTAGNLNSFNFKGGTTVDSKYSLLNRKSGNMSVGLGVAYTKLKSNDSETNNNHQETMYQMVVPMNFNIGQLSLMTSPRIGYAYGNYERTGFNNQNYKGNIEKRVYGLMNEIRYPMNVGNWLIEPSIEFNVLGYNQKGHENVKDFSLNIASQNTYSVESGVGLYLTNEQKLGKDKNLKINIGAAAYHEFADPYKLDVGMTGMQGAFTLEDEDASQNHAITRLGIDYMNKNYSVYGTLTSYLDRETNALFKSGFKMNF